MTKCEIIKYFVETVFDKDVDWVEIDLFELIESRRDLLSDVAEYVFDFIHWEGIYLFGANKYLVIMRLYNFISFCLVDRSLLLKLNNFDKVKVLIKKY